MWSQLIAASGNDLPAILDARGGNTDFPTLDANGVDTVKLATLRFILLGEQPDDEPVIQYMEAFREIVADPDNGPWVYQVPEDLIRLLATFSINDVPRISEAWAATDEARMDGWVASDLEAPLAEVSVFAANAVMRGDAIFLIIGL